MSDDKTKQDYYDRTRVAGNENYEVRYFAEKARISIEQAQDLIARHGDDRATLESEAAKIGRA